MHLLPSKFLVQPVRHAGALRPAHGNVHSADGWQEVLDPVIARYAGRNLGGRFFRADAAYAIPALYERLEETGYFYAIRLRANNVLREQIAHRLTRPVGRPSQTKVKRFHEDFQYQAASWDKARRVIAKIEWHPGELFPRVGFIVTNLPMEPDEVTRFYNRRAQLSSTSRKESTPSTGRGCHAGGSATTKCGCSYTRWPTTWLPSCAASNCQRPWPTGR